MVLNVKQFQADTQPINVILLTRAALIGRWFGCFHRLI